MKKVLPLGRRFLQDHFCTEKYHVDWLAALKEDVEADAKTHDADLGYAKTIRKLGGICEARISEIREFESLGLMSSEQADRWINEILGLYEEWKEKGK